MRCNKIDKSPASAGDLHFRIRNVISIIVNNETTMGHDIKTVKEAVALLLRVWRDAFSFFLSIELWMMVLVAASTVGGAWLAVMGDAWSLSAFAFAIGYVVTRTVLHQKRILAWPFI